MTCKLSFAQSSQVVLLPLFLLLAGSAAQAQTALIAHRSHGGAARTFAAGLTADNFGRVPMPVEEVGEKLTVTKVVRLPTGKVIRYGISDVQGAVVDTFAQGFYFNDPTVTTKEARQYFGPGVEVVGFGRHKLLKAKPGGPKAPLTPQQLPGRPPEPAPDKTSGPTKRRSSVLPVAALPPNHTGPTLLLVLVSVGAGGLLWRWRTYAAAPQAA